MHARTDSCRPPRYTAVVVEPLPAARNVLLYLGISIPVFLWRGLYSRTRKPSIARDITRMQRNLTWPSEPDLGSVLRDVREQPAELPQAKCVSNQVGVQ
jgi:hypothetical protein